MAFHKSAFSGQAPLGPAKDRLRNTRCVSQPIDRETGKTVRYEKGIIKINETDLPVNMDDLAAWILERMDDR